MRDQARLSQQRQRSWSESSTSHYPAFSRPIGTNSPRESADACYGCAAVIADTPAHRLGLRGLPCSPVRPARLGGTCSIRAQAAPPVRLPAARRSSATAAVRVHDDLR
jgi:hypothetical protein